MRTNRQLSASRQIHAAIKHYRMGEFECAITLSSAAEGQIPEPKRQTHLFAILREAVLKRSILVGEKDNFNFAANWLKHNWGNDEVEISEVLVIFWLNRAISKYRESYGGCTPEMVDVFPWAADT